MQLVEIVLAVLPPPVAVAMRRGSTAVQVSLDVLLLICGWFPGVVYALWLVTAGSRTVRDAAATPGDRTLWSGGRSRRP